VEEVLMRSEVELRVALCGIGIEAYWEQFDALRPQLEGYLRDMAVRLSLPGMELLELGLVDTPVRAREAGHECRRADVDLLLIYVTTYALSSTVLPLVQRAGVPVVVLNLQPRAAIDYDAFNKLPDRKAMTGAWLAYCSSCAVPEISNVFKRAAIPFHQVTGVLSDERTWAQINEWLAAARVKSMLADARLGLLGHYYNGMLGCEYGCDADLHHVWNACGTT
jgi:L-arabinose isomerase